MREEYKLPVFYFMLLGAFASWQAFFNLHLDGIGFSSMQIGILNALFISTSAVVVPFWGMFADKFGGNRILLLMSVVCSTLGFFIESRQTFADPLETTMTLGVSWSPLMLLELRDRWD